MTDLDKDLKKTEENPSGYDVKKEEPKADNQDHLDEFGYEKPIQEKKDGKESKESSEKSSEKSSQKDDEKELLDQKVEPASGYEKEPPKDAGSKEPEKKEEIVAAPAAKDDEFDIKDPGDLLPDEINAIKDFVKKYKVSKEVASGLVEVKKAEIAKLQASIKDHKEKSAKEMLKVRHGWYEELKADAEFGGEKFDFNVKRVDKVMQDFLPNLKKKLTDSKGMLPPYIMRDLAKLGSHLYSSENLVGGDPSKGEKESKEKENDPLAFYNS